MPAPGESSIVPASWLDLPLRRPPAVSLVTFGAPAVGMEPLNNLLQGQIVTRGYNVKGDKVPRPPVEVYEGSAGLGVELELSATPSKHGVTEPHSPAVTALCTIT